MSLNIDSSEPDYWLLVTIQFAILVNVNDSLAAIALLGLSSVITAALLLYQTAPGAVRTIKKASK